MNCNPLRWRRARRQSRRAQRIALLRSTYSTTMLAGLIERGIPLPEAGRILRDEMARWDSKWAGGDR